MHRIAESLTAAGYTITLVGRKLDASLPLRQKSFQQKRLRCWFNTGFLFYAEYNLRLFFFLSGKKMDIICAIDLDTILPCLFVSAIKGIPRVYDAHEYFTELKEVRTRPLVKKIWLVIERFTIPRFKNGYTVSKGLADEFQTKYKRNYAVIRNLPVLKELRPVTKEGFILYQGAVNEGRGFEYLIPAMKKINYPLVICGNGNFMPRLKQLIEENDVGSKIELKGMLLPAELFQIAQRAALGIGLAEREGLNQYLALPNKFFDYIQAGLPQITMNYPEYQKINNQFKVAILLDTLSIEVVGYAIKQLMEQRELLDKLYRNCLQARQLYCWQNEEKELIRFYQNIFKSE